ncbi:autotransporter domain-containing protein [Fodinicurvata sp. EGI_FJ10296]|uniref:autotransporter family protein n=1 Tax=Fodinicurvata sp. EGI_FJ10296 TaxID=3231908 RepID=UPI003454DE94
MSEVNEFTTRSARTGEDDNTCFVKFRRPTRAARRSRMALPVAAAIAAGTSAAEPAIAAPDAHYWSSNTSTTWNDDNNWGYHGAPDVKSTLDIVIDQTDAVPAIVDSTENSGSGFVLVGRDDGHTGRLDINSSGGSGTVGLTSLGARIGQGGSGEVNVSGQGATWTLHNNFGGLVVGDAGTGVLRIDDGATVSVADGKGTIDLGRQNTGSGTIAIGGMAGQTASAPGTLNADRLQMNTGSGQLVFNHTGDDYEFDAQIVSELNPPRSVPDHHIRHLAGVTRLTADSNGFLGATSVDGGTLIVGNRLGGTMTVGANGTLRGTGTIGPLTLNGVLEPGNPGGTMTVNGNATFNSGSTYRVHVDRNGTSRTNVNGNAVIEGGTVDVISLEADGDESVVGTHEILQAATRTGEFDDVVANYAFLDPSLSYDDSRVFLTLALREVPDPGPDPETTPDPVMTHLQALARPFAGNANQQGLVAILDSLDQSDPRYQAFVEEFRKLSDDEVSAVLEELSGSRSAGTSGISVTFSTALMDFVQMANGFGGFGGTGAQTASALTPGTIQFASAEPLARSEYDEVAQAPAPAGAGRADGPASWVRLVGQTGRQGSADGMPGSDSRSGGLHAGIDMPVNDAVSVGAAIGYEQGRVTSGGMLGVDTESYSGAVYGRYQRDDLRLSGAFSYSRIDYDSSRDVPQFGRQSAEYHADAWNIDAQAAYDFRPGPDGLTVSPLVGVRYIGMRQEGYEESGDAGLSVDGLTSDSLRARLGAETRFESTTAAGTTVALTARAAWSREIGSPETALRASLLGSDSFAIQGQGLPRDIAELGVTLDVGVTDNVDLFAAYDGSLGDNYADHRGQAGLRFTW